MKSQQKPTPRPERYKRERSFAFPLALYLISFSYFAQFLIAYLSS